jgi:hypothetical protein
MALKDWGRNFQGAWRKGWHAAAAGRGLESCPYPDVRQSGPRDGPGRITFSEGYRRAWKEGWDTFHAEARTGPALPFAPPPAPPRERQA